MCTSSCVCLTVVHTHGHTATGGAAAEAGERQAAGAEVHLAAGGEWKEGKALTGGWVGAPLTSLFPSVCSKAPQLSVMLPPLPKPLKWGSFLGEVIGLGTTLDGV